MEVGYMEFFVLFCFSFALVKKTWPAIKLSEQTEPVLGSQFMRLI